MSSEQIWAPWRIPYILATKDAQPNECFICRAVADTQDRENLLVKRTARSVTIMNRFPYNNGHLLVAPRAHLGELSELDDATLLDGMQLLRAMTELLRRTIQPHGFNVGLNLGRVAGAGLPGHLHWHIVPRWNGDTNFMSVIGEVEVISQSLAALYDLLQAELQQTPPTG